MPDKIVLRDNYILDNIKVERSVRKRRRRCPLDAIVRPSFPKLIE